MTYTVHYKKINSIFWKKIRGVKGDGMIDETAGRVSSGGFAMTTRNSGRWFILEDETRIEIPTEDVIFRFSRERFLSIKLQMERESGQRLV